MFLEHLDQILLSPEQQGSLLDTLHEFAVEILHRCLRATDEVASGYQHDLSWESSIKIRM